MKVSRWNEPRDGSDSHIPTPPLLRRKGSMHVALVAFHDDVLGFERRSPVSSPWSTISNSLPPALTSRQNP
ncbi:hypothetical protein MTO96_031844 [Rhipicephalus appendiculatus]